MTIKKEAIYVIVSGDIKNPYRQVELHEKYAKHIPIEYCNILCPCPLAKTIQLVAVEQNLRSKILKKDGRKENYFGKKTKFRYSVVTRYCY